MQRTRLHFSFLFLFAFLALYSCSSHKQVVMRKAIPSEKVETSSPQTIHSPNQGVVNFELAKEIPVKAEIPKDTLKDNYETAFQRINSMLDGTSALSFKEAVYTVENTWYGNKVPYAVFDQEIQRLTKLTKAYMKANQHIKYLESDSLNLLKNLAICRILKDTIYYVKDSSDRKFIAHLPYTYDFSDFLGKTNWSKMFVSKLVATGSGNCHSLPYLYRILAEELDAKCWLSLAPNHIYIKNKRKDIGWYNTELTSGGFPDDAWLSASGYISLEAIRSGIYMDTLSQKQSIGLCLYDLAKGYENQRRNYSDGFIIKCCDAVLKYQPNNINAMILKAEALRNSMPNAPPNSEMQNLCVKVLDLGYREMPQQMYLEWLTSSEGKKVDTTHIYTHNPFESIGKEGKMLTLGNGRFDEMPNNDSIQHIGSIVVNLQSRKVTGFLTKENKEYIIQEPTLISRHWSIDPLANHPNQIGMSPYSAFWNNPIRYDDPDGNCPTCPFALAGAGLGALIGGSIEAGMQLYKNGEVTDWRAVGGAATAGAITGAVAGLTAGASLGTTIAYGTAANVAGGIANRTVQGKATNFNDVAIDVATGAMGSVLGSSVKAIGNAVATKLANRAAAKAAETGVKGITVLGKYPDYINLASNLNARRFSIPSKIWEKMSPNEQWAANVKFLDRTIARGDDILLSNPVKDINKVRGYFRKELDYLINKGYKLSADGKQLAKSK